MKSEKAPLVGEVVAGRYQVESLLGEGGMGAVYLAKHIALEKNVALKVLHGEYLRKEELVERFLQEAKAASRIRNEHVIDITDFGATPEGQVFFAMEHLQGRDLHSLLFEYRVDGNIMPWERAQDIFLQVCEALAAAHKEGIIHRDLKPENIFLVDGTGRKDFVKLLDFGIAKVESVGEGADGERKLTKTGMLFGTPEYMAPEQARGEKPDHRVDVYAMGCMLFQFVTGSVPFHADTFMAILTQHMMSPIPEIGSAVLARSGAPLGVIDILNRALEKDRDKRFGSMDEFAQAVRSLEGSAYPEGIAPLATKRRHRDTDWVGNVRPASELESERMPAVESSPTKKGWVFAAGAFALAAGLAAFVVSRDDGPAVPAEVPVEVSPAQPATQGIVQPDESGLDKQNSAGQENAVEDGRGSETTLGNASPVVEKGGESATSAAPKEHTSPSTAEREKETLVKDSGKKDTGKEDSGKEDSGQHKAGKDGNETKAASAETVKGGTDADAPPQDKGKTPGKDKGPEGDPEIGEVELKGFDLEGSP